MKLSSLYFICLNYKDMTAKEMSNLTGVQHKAIHEALRRAGCKKVPNWREEEINFLIIMGAKTTSRYFNRSLNSCKIKYSRWKNTKLIN